jgi:hypothetical protein
MFDKLTRWIVGKSKAKEEYFTDDEMHDWLKLESTRVGKIWNPESPQAEAIIFHLFRQTCELREDIEALKLYLVDLKKRT